METPDDVFSGMDRPADEPFAAESAEAAPDASQTSDAPAAEAAAPASAAAAEPVATAVPAVVPEPVVPPAAKVERMVPLSALEQERANYEKRIRALEEGNRPKPAEAAPTPVPDPDFVEDPKGYVDASRAKVDAALEALKKQGTTQIEQQGRELQDLKLHQSITAAEAQIATTTPDYMNALMHVRDVRMQQLQIMHPSATPEQIGQTIQAEERQMAAAELGRGNNPYEVLYRIAKTFGYMKAAPAASAAAPSVPATPISDGVKKPNGALPPDMTLGKTGGSAPDVAQDDGESEDPLTAAFSERFGRKRA